MISNVIEKLIDIGNTLPESIPSGSKTLLGLNPNTLWFAKTEWYRGISNLTIDELSALLRGLVMVLDLSRLDPGLHRENAIQIRWIFHYIQDKDFMLNSSLDFSTRLADYLLSNTNRCDVPLGSESNFGAKSYKELIRNRVAFRRMREYTLDRIRTRKAIGEIHRNIRRKQCKNTASNKGTPTHEKRIEELKALTVYEKLKIIANDDQYSIGFYPGSIAHEATPEVIAELDETIKLMLLAKLKGKRKGPWKVLKKKLLESFRESDRDYHSTPWNRENWY